MNARIFVAALAFAGCVAWLGETGVLDSRTADNAPPAYTLVIYTADWCEPCQRLKRDIERSPEMLRGAAVEYRDASELGPINVRVPDIRLYRGDEAVARTVGYHGRKAFDKWLEESIP